MTLKSLIGSDVDNVFMNTDDFAETCGYVQGAAEAVSVTAIAYNVEYETQDSEGFKTTFQSKDWLIPADDLAGVIPRAGDRIRRTVAAETHVYEITPVDANRPAAARDDTEYLWRLHSKLIGVE